MRRCLFMLSLILRVHFILFLFSFRRELRPMKSVHRILSNALTVPFCAVHFRLLLFGFSFVLLNLANAIILPPGAHMQSLSQIESAELGTECGRSTESLPSRRGRAHPWAVSFMAKGRNRLGGTIISPWHILTVAHGFLRFDTTASGKCDVFGYRNFETMRHGWAVVYGDDCIWQQQNDYLCAKPNLTQNRIRAVFVDDGFAEGGCVSGHDWAIVELEVPIAFSDRVQPICLPTSPSQQRISDGEVLTVTSWGRRDAFHKGDPLMREIPLRHDAECKGRPWSDIMPTNVEDYLCAKALNPKDYHSARTCHGDSGSGMEWKKLVNRVIDIITPTPWAKSLFPPLRPQNVPTFSEFVPSPPSVELTNGTVSSQSKANGIAMATTEKKMPLRKKRRRAKIKL